MRADSFEIRGGAGEYEAAAIAAVVQHVLETEDVLRGLLPPPNVFPAWVRSGRPAPISRFSPPVLPERGLNWPR